LVIALSLVLDSSRYQEPGYAGIDSTPLQAARLAYGNGGGAEAVDDDR